MVSGSAPGAGHGSFFVDKQGKLWTICMVAFTQNGGNGNTLMSLFPTDVDKEGVMHANIEYGDYPQYLPGVKKDPITDDFTGWTLLSLEQEGPNIFHAAPRCPDGQLLAVIGGGSEREDVLERSNGQCGRIHDRRPRQDE